MGRYRLLGRFSANAESESPFKKKTSWALENGRDATLRESAQPGARGWVRLGDPEETGALHCRTTNAPVLHMWDTAVSRARLDEFKILKN